jgi:hypothetical protein
MHANTHVHTRVFLLTFRPEFRPRWWLLSGFWFGDVSSQLSGYFSLVNEKDATCIRLPGRQFAESGESLHDIFLAHAKRIYYPSTIFAARLVYVIMASYQAIFLRQGYPFIGFPCDYVYDGTWVLYIEPRANLFLQMNVNSRDYGTPAQTKMVAWPGVWLVTWRILGSGLYTCCIDTRYPMEFWCQEYPSCDYHRILCTCNCKRSICHDLFSIVAVAI